MNSVPKLRVVKVTSGRTMALQAGLAALPSFGLGTAFHQVDVGREEGTSDGVDGRYRLTGYTDIGEKFLLDVHFTVVMRAPLETYGGVIVVRVPDNEETALGRVAWVHRPGEGFMVTQP